MSGILGIFQTPLQMGRDISQMKSVRNPLNPPANGPVSSLATFLQKWRDQGTVRARDVDQWLNETFSFYNGWGRAGKALSANVIESDAGDLEIFRRRVSEAREEGRKYLRAMNMEERARGGGGFRANENTPFNRDVIEAISLGRPEQARLIMLEELNKIEGEEQWNARLNGFRAAVRAQQPIRIGQGGSEQARRDFIAWARENVPEARLQRILEADRKYRRAAADAGLLADEEDPRTQRRIRQQERSRERRSQPMSPARRRQLERDRGIRR